ncbi:helix-turn-helix domain-containing protein [Christensenella tenuis]|uniref:Helix-turn-helix transcriptional regulator n=1 Tax=Christensenella tenuis TaxID=2763033 RepID=A0ABR7EFC6_9FIRM|nr:helix-turn-helix transcriptional regulator [Christensenella tenuis]MBC5648465.1 helix-turn-helix transcriptional regulator [Christensenella tenuis]
MEITKRLSELLQKKEIKKATFLADLGYSKNAFREWETGVTKSYMNKIDAIANYLDTSTDYLLGRTDDPAPTQNITAAHLKGGVDISDLPEDDQQDIMTFIEFKRAQRRDK